MNKKIENLVGRLNKKKHSKCLALSLVGLFMMALKISFVSISDQAVARNNELVYQSPDVDVVNFKKGVVNFYNLNGDLSQEKIPHLKAVRMANSKLGKAVILPILKSWPLAKAVGWYKKSRISSIFIEKFAKEFSINLSHFTPPDGVSYKSFNDFFTRKLSTAGVDAREPKDKDPKIFSSPADSKLFVLENLDSRDNFWVKESEFDLVDFLGDGDLADEFRGGSMLIFRLAPHDYHRFHAPVDLTVEAETELGGHLESVNPASYAMKRKPLAKNKRVIIECQNDKFGRFIVAPVGAMMVGKILVKDQEKFKKGAYMGHFELGGSTVIVMLRKGVLKASSKYLKHSFDGLETQTLVGDEIGRLN